MILYFGVAPRGTGHHCYHPGFTGVDARTVTPWTVDFRPVCEDAVFRQLFGRGLLDIPRSERVFGRRYHAHRAGWTLLFWWDSSGNERSGSHSTFVMEGALSADDAEIKARAAFPFVFRRMEAEGSPR